MTPRWSLQTRLTVTVTVIVSALLVAIAIATSAILGSVLDRQLQNSLNTAYERSSRTVQAAILGGAPDAATILNTPAPSPTWSTGFLLIVAGSNASGASGAYITDSGEVHALTSEQLLTVTDALSAPDPRTSVRIPELGNYLVKYAPLATTVAIMGYPRAEVEHVMSEMLTTTALLTAGGLVLLNVAVILLIRRGLRPLRSIADTATRITHEPLDDAAAEITDRVPGDDVDERTEIGRVGLALNVMLDHLDSSLRVRARKEEQMRRFVADASHELRTPLASIRGYSELALRSPALDENTEEALSRIQAQSLRMTGLVEDLLLLARLDESTELVPTTLDLTRLCVESLHDAQAAAPDHRWTLRIPDSPVLVEGDPRRLTQVLMNLLGNARAHTPAGTEVALELETEDAEAVIRIRDDGPGIDPALQGRLFERFARAESSRARASGGSGLGLSIVAAIVAGHRGTIAAESRPGDTCFTVRLPLTRSQDPVGAPA